MLEHENNKPAQFKINVGTTYTGKVHSVSTEWALIDINYREMIYVDMSKEDVGIKDQILPNSEVDIQILDNGSSNRRGFVLGSISAGIKTANFREIMASIEEGSTAYTGKVGQTIPGGGYIVEVQGIEGRSFGAYQYQELLSRICFLLQDQVHTPRLGLLEFQNYC